MIVLPVEQVCIRTATPGPRPWPANGCSARRASRYSPAISRN